MKTFILAFFASALLLTSSLSASYFDFFAIPYAEIGAGYRHDRTKWREGDLPNRFTLDDAHIMKMNLEFETSLFALVLLKAEGDVGLVFDGTGRSRSLDSYSYTSTAASPIISQLKGDYIYDYSLALGSNINPFLPWFNLFFPCTKLSPLLGYSFHYQRYEFDLQDSSNLNAALLRVKHYKTYWYGPWVGLGLSVDLVNILAFSLEYQYHLASLKKTVALDSYFHDESFHRFHHGSGNVGKANFRWSFCNGWTVDLMALIQSWTAHKTKWESYEFNINVGFIF
jgi:hypothetical protein